MKTEIQDLNVFTTDYLELRRCQLTCLSGEMRAIISVFIVFIAASISSNLQTCTYHNAIYC